MRAVQDQINFRNNRNDRTLTVDGIYGPKTQAGVRRARGSSFGPKRASRAAASAEDSPPSGAAAARLTALRP